MKRFIKILLLLFFPLLFYPSLLKAQDFNQEGQVNFKVRSNHYYEYSIKLRANTQYFFKLTGESIFNFKLIEQSGNEWQLHVSDNNEIMVMENIMDKGIYIVRIYTVADNNINMIWGEY